MQLLDRDPPRANRKGLTNKAPTSPQVAEKSQTKGLIAHRFSVNAHIHVFLGLQFEFKMEVVYKMPKMS
jgi:hypothetical protein